jgi:hypothetical protein
VIQKSNVQTSVLKTLAYFDIFKYPLTLDEIYRFSDTQVLKDKLLETVNSLEESADVFNLNGYYALTDDKSLYEKRKLDQERAENMINLAHENGKFVAKFPFIRSICLSGSISKMVMTEGADIDYFVISKKGRIWISKLLLTAYKKSFLRNRADYFCLNYFISDADLLIPDKNLFSATELATLIPVTNGQLFSKFIQSNKWFRDYLPNAGLDMQEFEKLPSPPQTRTARFIEVILKGPLGDMADFFAHNLFKIVNKRRYYKKHKKHYSQMFRSSRGQSKIHTSNHQNVVMTKYIAKCKTLNLDTSI